MNQILTSSSNAEDNTFQLSVVVPCYNEEDGIAEFHRRMSAAIKAKRIAAEIVYVNDGSKDNTLECLKGFVAADTTITIVGLSRNYGHQLAVTAGLEYARGNRALIIDADLQDPPE